MQQRPADRIRETLEQEIVTGTLPNGHKLDEMSLSDRFDVSRTPVREALQSLASAGLVELRPHRGAFVSQPSLRDMVEMFEVMAELEALCVRLASRRATRTDIDRLETTCATCEAAFDTGDADRYYRANEAFHLAIYAAGGNSFLAARATELHHRLSAFRRLQLRTRNRLRHSLDEHRAIVEAIKDGDSEHAAELMRGHILVQGERFSDLAAQYQRTALAEPA